MRILFCSQNPLVKELGAPKIMIELAEALQESGWSPKIASPSEIAPNQKYRKRFNIALFAESLGDYLFKYAPEYDVVEYDHIYLPYPRTGFCSKTLFVARVTLLIHHLLNFPIPLMKSYRSRLHSLVMGRFDKLRYQRIMQYAQMTLQQADLINVANYDDKTELVRCCIPEEKIVVLPYGISQSRRFLFDAVSSELPEEPKVVFVGSFDDRKGAKDLPVILEDIYNKILGVKFRLLGTGGRKTDILAKFPKRLRNCIEIIPNFLSDTLPGFLSTCSLGIFPSYAESFGFGILEMIAASIPVIAYNVPGPSMILPSEYLVSRGDAKGMSLKAAMLLKDKVKLKAARIWVKERSREFSWQRVAQETSRIYLEHWQKKQTNNT